MSWLSSVQRVVRQLADVIRPTFGPQGLDQLLLSPTSSMLITSSASTIFHALTPSHPIASLVCHQLRSTSQLVGDGSAALLLLLEAAVDEAVRAVTERGVKVHDERDASSHVQRMQYAQAMQWLLAGLARVEREWLGGLGEKDEEEMGLMRAMRRSGRDVADDFSSALSACVQLLETQLGQPPHVAASCSTAYELQRLMAVLCAGLHCV